VPATWGQVYQWNEIHANPARVATGGYNVCGLIRPRSRGVKFQLALKSAVRLIEENESLRTDFRQRDGVLYQVIPDSRTVFMEAIQSTPESVDEDAAACRARFGEAAFDLDSECLFRVGFVNIEDRTRRMVFGASHLLIDGVGMKILAAEFERLLAGGSPGRRPAMQPAEIAARQSDADLAKHSERAVRYWCTQYRHLKDALPSRVRGEGTGKRAQGTLFSPALSRACVLMARRCKVSVSTILVAATAVLLGTWFNCDPWGMRLIVHNRFRAEFSNAITSMVQRALLTVELGDARSLEELAPRVVKSLVRALRCAFYNEERLQAALAQLQHDLARDADVSCCFNDFNVLGYPSADAADLSRPELAELLTRTTFTAAGPLPERCGFCLMTPQGEFESGITTTFSVMASTEYLSGLSVETFLRSLEWLITESLFQRLSIGEVRNRWRVIA
jgi:hypothetical protein